MAVGHIPGQSEPFHRVRRALGTVSSPDRAGPHLGRNCWLILRLPFSVLCFSRLVVSFTRHSMREYHRRLVAALHCTTVNNRWSC